MRGLRVTADLVTGRLRGEPFCNRGTDLLVKFGFANDAPFPNLLA